MPNRSQARRPKATVATFHPAPAVPDRRLVWAGALGLVAAGFVAYHGSLTVPFLFDDIPAIVENQSIRDLTQLGRVLQPPAQGSGIDSRPLVNLSLALNHALGGFNPRGYHLANIVIHVLAALALFGLLRRTLLLPGLPDYLRTAALPAAFGCTLLWTVHPLLTETVICVVQRNESLLGLFYLLTLYCFLRAAGPGGTGKWFWLMLGCCLAGMATKEVMVSAPLIVLLFDRTFVAGSFREAWRQRWPWYAGLAATWVLLAALVLASGGDRGGTSGFGQGVTAWTYLLTQARAIVLYLKLSVWPHPLIVDYGTWLAPGFRAVALEFVAISSLFCLTLWALWRRPRVGFVGACFFAILAPSSSVYPLISQTIAEHRMYLPLAAVLVMLVLGGLRLGGARLVVISCLVLAAGATVLTIRRSADYASEEVLWTDLIKKAPESPWAYFNLGTWYFKRGDFAAAEAMNGKAARMMPGHFSIQLAWGLALEKIGREEEATVVYREVLWLKPRTLPALFRLGVVSLKQGRTEEAIRCFKEFLRLQPEDFDLPDIFDATGNLGTAYLQLGRFAEAEPLLARVAAARPDSVDAHYNLAVTLARLGRHGDALGHLQTAARLAPGAADVHFNLGNVLVELGRNGEARRHYAEAWRLDPTLRAAREMLERLQPERSNK